MTRPLYNLAFLGILATLLFGALIPAVRHLPRMEWQFLASVPTRHQADGSWQGVNLTWYGFIVATANTLATAVFYVLVSAMGVSRAEFLILVGATFAVSLPAARLVARVVEGRRNTFTVSGASFVGLATFPGVVWALPRVVGTSGAAPDVVALLAALSVSYALGEGVGRTACISFGCCFGKPLAQCGPRLRRLLEPFAVRYTGHTKKASYDANLEGTPVVPIQAMTSLIYLSASLTGIGLLLWGHAQAALCVSLSVTQGWRVLSEFLRSDHRGALKFSAYQVLSLGAIAYALLIILGSSAVVTSSTPDVAAGLRALWDPLMVLVLQALWALVFLYMGRSTVTHSVIHFHVVEG